MDTMIFEKIYIDDCFFQIKITCSNPRISMHASVYVSDNELKELQDGIKNLLKIPFCVVLGNDDDSFLDCVRFSFLCTQLGHIEITIFMKSMVDTNRNDTASFLLTTDISSLDTFAEELNHIINGEVGETAVLNPPSE